MRMGGQVRAIPAAVLGWDMTAAVMLAEALGYCRVAVAELLPEIEAIAVARTNEHNRDSDE